MASNFFEPAASGFVNRISSMVWAIFLVVFSLAGVNTVLVLVLAFWFSNVSSSNADVKASTLIIPLLSSSPLLKLKSNVLSRYFVIYFFFLSLIFHRTAPWYVVRRE